MHWVTLGWFLSKEFFMECLQGTPVPHYLHWYFCHVDLKDKIGLGDSNSIIAKNTKKTHKNWNNNNNNKKLKNLPHSITGGQKYKTSSNFAPRSLCIANNSILLTSHKCTLKKQVNKCNCEKYNDVSKSKFCSSQGACVHLFHSIFVCDFIFPLYFKTSEWLFP